ncbi:MAG: LPS assembly lipoprotein LptE [Planctomycetota bacterium]|nr:LPS assembly lipoprotein LptE [Planctomycetota bacterium]
MAVVSLCFGGQGCGYRLGYDAPEGVRTVAVPIFQNATFPLRRGIEYELTDSLRREIQARAPVGLVDGDRADMVVYGTVADFQELVLAEGRQDQELESAIVVRVDLLVEDRVNRRRWTRTVSDREPFSVARGETIDEARRRAIDNLAEKILMALDAW